MYRIGIDLGGTNIAVGVVDDRHNIIAEASVPTGAFRPAEEMVADMCRAVELALDKAGLIAADCASIGIGSPGTCDSEAGVVVRAYNLGWFNVPVCRMLHERFGIPVRLSNDANCAALAETVAGAAVGRRDMILITLGTGVGGGIIIDGKIYAGMRSMGAELGHTLLVLEQHPESALHGREELTALDVFQAADAGDAAAQAVIDRWCVYVAAGMTDLVNSLAPEMILIGGGISRQGERILSPIREYVAEHCFGGREGAVPIIAAAKLGNEAGIIGAAAL